MRSKVACTVREGAGYFANPPISSSYCFMTLAEAFGKNKKPLNAKRQEAVYIPKYKTYL